MARPDEVRENAPEADQIPLKAALDRHDARKHQDRLRGGLGLNETKLVRPEGFEPPTFCSEDRRSNPLSYGRIFNYASVYILTEKETLMKQWAQFILLLLSLFGLARTYLPVLAL